MKTIVFKATILHCKATYTVLGTTWTNEINFVMNHAPGAGLLYLLTSSPACYHCATDAPHVHKEGSIIISSTYWNSVLVLPVACQRDCRQQRWTCL